MKKKVKCILIPQAFSTSAEIFPGPLGVLPWVGWVFLSLIASQLSSPPFRQCWLRVKHLQLLEALFRIYLQLLCIPSLRGTEDINRQLIMASLAKVGCLLYAFSLRNLCRKNMNSCFSYVTPTWIPIVWWEAVTLVRKVTRNISVVKKTNNVYEEILMTWENYYIVSRDENKIQNLPKILCLFLESYCSFLSLSFHFPKWQERNRKGKETCSWNILLF